MENALESIGNRADYMEERISELEDRIMEVLQVGEEIWDICIHIADHFVVQQKLTQHCKAIILQ